jgi:ACS family D-galactonate transporter-like MFS transporter
VFRVAASSAGLPMDPGSKTTASAERTLTPLVVSNARRRALVGLLFVASLINYLDRATISMALPLISRDLGLDPTTKGMLLSAFFWSYAVMQIPIGWCADRFNLRWLYAGAFALWSVAQGLTGLAEGLAALIAFRVLLGVGESIYLPGGTKIVCLLFPPKERGLPSGFFDFGTRSGLVLEGLLIPWLLVRCGWRTTFAAVGFLALLWLVPWFLVSPPRLSGSAALEAGARRPFAALRAGSKLRYRIKINRNLLGICLGFFCFDYYWYLLVGWLPDYFVTVRHLTVLRAGIYTALPFLVFGISEPLGGLLADWLIQSGWEETRTRKGMVTVAFATGVFLIPAMRAASPGAAMALVIGGSLVGLSTGNLIVILQCCAPPEQVGIWTGVENFAGNVAGIVAPLATGLLIKSTGSYLPGFALGPAVLLAGLLSYWFIVGKLTPERRSG